MVRVMAAAILVVAVLPGCAVETADGEDNGVTIAVCVIKPTEGNNVTGVVRFRKDGDGVIVTAEITGLTPGKHGFHVHQFGDVSGLDGKSAGGHFNPEGTDHGAPVAEVRHVGDLGNLEADSNGKATYKSRDLMIKLSGEHGIIGRAIIIHARPDDFGQPTGNAGARVGYGVIGIAKP